LGKDFMKLIDINDKLTFTNQLNTLMINRNNGSTSKSFKINLLDYNNYKIE